MPNVHHAASLARQRLMGTHKGSADETRLPSYLDEFVFRFNRRCSRSCGPAFYRVLELSRHVRMFWPVWSQVSRGQAGR